MWKIKLLPSYWLAYIVLWYLSKLLQLKNIYNTTAVHRNWIIKNNIFWLYVFISSVIWDILHKYNYFSVKRWYYVMTFVCLISENLSFPIYYHKVLYNFCCCLLLNPLKVARSGYYHEVIKLTGLCLTTNLIN